MREWPVVGRLVSAGDRLWWARVIRAADIVDPDFVAFQFGRPVSARRAIGAYVRGGHRTGFSLNPLACERTIARQLPEDQRVPALYAYLVNERRTLDVSPNWDSRVYERAHPESLSDPGGPLGHAWRRGRSGGALLMGRGPSAIEVPWTRVVDAVTRRPNRRGPEHDLKGSGDQSGEGRLADQTLFICMIDAGEPDYDEALLLAATARSSGQTVAIGVVPGERETNRAGHADLWTQIALFTLWQPQVAVIPLSRGSGDGALIELERLSDAGAYARIVVRGPGENTTSEDLEKLADAAESQPTYPLWLKPDGTVASAGVVVCAGRRVHLLAGHPREDADRMGSSIAVPMGAPVTHARPAHTGGGPAVTLLGSVVVGPARDLAPGGAHLPDTDIQTLLDPVGLTVIGNTPSGPQLLRRRHEHQAVLADGTRLPSLRWAIKTPAPAGPTGDAWGDRHFARGLARALHRLEQDVVIDAYEARDRVDRTLDDISLVIRGPKRIDPPAGLPSILWIISHPDEITAEELAAFDLVFAASEPWAREASARYGREVSPLLQCTDTRLFRPRGAPRTDDIVFVGTARGIARPSVVAPIEAGVPVKVYGPDWRAYISPDHIVATGIANSDLPLRYETAKVVLNDHWPAMQAHGFVSNRLYDVVAAGGRAISDDVTGIAELFGGSVLTYRTIPELLNQLTGDVDSLFPDQHELARIGSIVRERDSFDARAESLVRGALRVV